MGNQNNDFKDLVNQIQSDANVKAVDQATKDLKILYDSFVHNGFTESQAMNLLCAFNKNQRQTIKNKNCRLLRGLLKGNSGVSMFNPIIP